ncbi:hypothetical protein GCM10010168_45500 [Actinoplanes ianthinogenes]|uniref:Cytochrome C biogenesis protein transmembrane region n=1 Tax=Actinoplanes ianthinogenes TaxID=122358 RepID=A0ABN6C6U0_9ACTN|nr:hypothetical protein [Actinoplanes ianthinogenes]BCJ41152.1 hypothetical protein Aiant_18090 [Actinoplanes ianthinogenes]GGR22548.1 hypothetical protein GCM10010168_45500 [Actinoplanes ianthinogenes]
MTQQLLAEPAITPAATRPRTGRIVAASAAAGVLLAVLWSYKFVDSVIGDNVANTLLDHDAKHTAIAGTVAGLIFAFVSGLAGTFTACNIAMAAAVGPLSQTGSRTVLRPIGWLAVGMISVSAVYGFVGVLLGDRLPQLSTATAAGLPVRLIQASVVFGVIGLALTYLGLASLGVLPDVFRNRPVGRVVTLGALIGGFLIGRPYPLFNKLFHWAVETGNPLNGAAAFVLQSLGNIVVVSVLFALLTLATRGRFTRWLARDHRRAAVFTGVLLIALGVFTVVYWDVRLPSMFGYGWFPTMPYNG